MIDLTGLMARLTRWSIEEKFNPTTRATLHVSTVKFNRDLNRVDGIIYNPCVDFNILRILSSRRYPFERH